MLSRFLCPTADQPLLFCSLVLRRAADDMTTIRADPFAPRLDLRHGDPTRKVAMPIPDLRFEYTYVKSVKSYIHVDRSTGQESSLLDKSEASPSGGEVVRVDWVRVLGVTVRDQLFAPFVQGAIW